MSHSLTTTILILLFMFISSAESFEPTFFELGTINYGHLISSQPWIRQQEERKMLYAMEQLGFMVLTNHGISKQIMDEMWNVTKNFFDTTKENKNHVLMTNDYIYGYSAKETLRISEDIEYFNTSNTDNNSNNITASSSSPMVADQKEMFAAWIGAENTNRLNDVLWPPEPADMKQKWVTYYRECEKLAAQLLRSFASILELEDANYFEQFIDDHMSAIRALNYPKQDDENIVPEHSMRCSAHSDYGTFTLLRQDGVGGLQLELNKDEWVDVISDHYDFIVNLGNTMKVWTNDRFKSTRHRVVNPRNDKESERRQSIAFFHNLNGNAKVETFPSCLKNGTSKYEPIKFLDFLNALHLSAQIENYNE